MHFKIMVLGKQHPGLRSFFSKHLLFGLRHSRKPQNGAFWAAGKGAVLLNFHWAPLLLQSTEAPIKRFLVWTELVSSRDSSLWTRYCFCPEVCITKTDRCHRGYSVLSTTLNLKKSWNIKNIWEEKVFVRYWKSYYVAPFCFAGCPDDRLWMILKLRIIQWLLC